MRLPKKVNPFFKNILLVLAVSAIAAWTWYWWPRSNSKHRTVLVPENKELPSSETWKVLNVSDGDTVLAQKGNEKVRISFCGIDAPESSQPLGSEARDYLNQLIARGNGNVEVMEMARDRYGRVVAELFVIPLQPSQLGEEIFLNAEMVLGGYAYHYSQSSQNCFNRDAIISASVMAKANRVGVWTDINGGERPWDYRKRQK